MNTKKKETTGAKTRRPRLRSVPPPPALPESAPGSAYAPADWRAMFVDALPLLEWVAAHGSDAGSLKQDQARRLIVRHYIAATSRPGLAKTRSTS